MESCARCPSCRPGFLGAPRRPGMLWDAGGAHVVRGLAWCVGCFPRPRPRISITPTTTITTLATPTTPMADVEFAPAGSPDGPTPAELPASLDADPAAPAGSVLSKCHCCPKMSAVREFEGRCCAVMAIVTFMGMVVGLALFSDPLLLNLSTKLRRATCVTVANVTRRGLSVCDWSSCKESCTTQQFMCMQIEVNYTLVDEVGDATANASSARPGAPLPRGTVRLSVNIAGCGYGYSCTDFNEQYGVGNGTPFECEVAEDLGAGPVAVPVATQDAVPFKIPSWVASAVPIALCVLCIAYIRARRLFSLDAKHAPPKKRASLRGQKTEPRSFYRKKMLEIEEWRRQRQELLERRQRGGRPSDGEDSELAAEDDPGVEDEDGEDEEEDDDDLHDVIVATADVEPLRESSDDEYYPSIQCQSDDSDVEVAQDGWRGRPVVRPIQTVSCAVEHECKFDIAQ